MDDLTHRPEPTDPNHSFDGSLEDDPPSLLDDKLRRLNSNLTTPRILTPTQIGEYLEKLDDLIEIVPEHILCQVLPENPEIRSLQAHVVIRQLHRSLYGANTENADPLQFTDKEDLIAHSRILEILSIPYQTVFFAEHEIAITKAFLGASTQDSLSELFSLVQSGQIGMNSTLRNLFMAKEIEREIAPSRFDDTVKSHHQYEVRVGLASYTWKDKNDSFSKYPLIDLPGNTATATRYKFVVVIDHSNGDRLLVADYGEDEGSENIGLYPTGEGIGSAAINGVLDTFPIWQDDRCRDGLKQIMRSQERGSIDEKLAEKLLTLNRGSLKLYHSFLQTDEGRNMPNVAVKLSDYTEPQLEAIFQLAATFRGMGVRRAFTVHDGTILSDFQQPSTRTKSAVENLSQITGLHLTTQEGGSSRKKGETISSEELANIAAKIDVIYERGPDVENIAEELKKFRDRSPVYRSAGGGTHHPSQTMADLMTLMDHYECTNYSFQELRERTCTNPPTITFLGQTDQKRADKALIESIAKHLPNWKIQVVVPTENDIPKLNIPEDANCTVEVSEQLSTYPVLTNIIDQSNILYVSNPATTSNVDGSKPKHGEETQHPFVIDKSILKLCNIELFMHPLPASDEVAPDLLEKDSPRSGLFRQMENKYLIMSADTVFALGAKKLRQNPSRIKEVA